MRDVPLASIPDPRIVRASVCVPYAIQTRILARVKYNCDVRPGPKPKGQVAIVWSPHFAYAVGLLTADGYLSKDGRHIDLTSKDKSQVVLFKKCLGLRTKIGEKYSGNKNLAYHTQFGDVLFYRFLLGIGLFSTISKTLAEVDVPREFFVDFYEGTLTVMVLLLHITTLRFREAFDYICLLHQLVRRLGIGCAPKLIGSCMLKAT